jgi:hypothetical protein
MLRSVYQTGTVMIATLGTEPQVVTAAFDLLRQEGERPGRVVVLHTSAPSGGPGWRAGLERRQALHRLQTPYV